MTVSDKQYGVVAPDVLLSHSGLDFLQSMVDGKVPNPPICKVLNFHLADVGEGRVAFEGMPDGSFYNPFGTVHGGVAMTLLDSALSCAILTTLAKGEKLTTLEIKVNLTRPILKDTGLLRAEGRVIHRGRMVATSEGELKDKAGKLYAHATTTCMIFPAKNNLA
jgi:uncharacterized protein (TIGR00369 family)